MAPRIHDWKHPFDATGASTAAPSAPAAQRFPPELFKRVIDLLCGAHLSTFSWAAPSIELRYREVRDPPIKLTKRELGNCALTCRYWAKQCRELLFTELSLRTRGDPEALLSFIKEMKDPSLNISRFLRKLTLEYDFAEEPWSHLIFMARNILVNVHDIHIVIRGTPASKDIVDASTSLRSIHHLLPRPLSPSLSTCTRLTIRDMKFRDFEQIAVAMQSVRRLFQKEWPGPAPRICTVPAPVEYYLENLSWTRYRPDIPALQWTLGTQADCAATLWVENCAEPWLFLRTLVLSRTQGAPVPASMPPRAACIDTQDMVILEEFVRCALSTGAVRPDKEGNDEEKGENCGKYIFKRLIVSNSGQYYISIQCQPEQPCSPILAIDVGPGGRVSSIIIDFRSSGFSSSSVIDADIVDSTPFRLYGWEQLDEPLSRFGDRFRALTVQAGTDEAHMRAFASIVVSRMPRMLEAGKLKFWYMSFKDWKRKELIVPAPVVESETEA